MLLRFQKRRDEGGGFEKKKKSHGKNEFGSSARAESAVREKCDRPLGTETVEGADCLGVIGNISIIIRKAQRIPEEPQLNGGCIMASRLKRY